MIKTSKLLKKVVEIAQKHSISAPAVAINWLRAKPWVSAPIVGANYPEQLYGVMDGLDTTLSDDDIAALDSVSDFRRSRTTLET